MSFFFSGWLWFNRFSYLCETKGKANSYHMGKGRLVIYIRRADAKPI